MYARATSGPTCTNRPLVVGYTIVASSIAFDLLVLILTVAKTISTYRALARFEIEESLSSILLRDGTLLYL